MVVVGHRFELAGCWVLRPLRTRSGGFSWAKMIPIETARAVVNMNTLQSLVRQSLRVALENFSAVPGMRGFRRPDTMVPSCTLFGDLKDQNDGLSDDVVGDYPWGLRSRQLVAMAWDSDMASSSLSFSTLQLDRRTWLYFAFTDSWDDCLNLLAAVQTASPKDAHKQFLKEMFRSNGSTFEAEFFVSAPTEITSTFSRTFLAEGFVMASEAAIKNGHTTSEDFWEEVRNTITRHEPDCRALSEADLRTNAGRVLLMKSYLAAVTPRSKRKRG